MITSHDDLFGQFGSWYKNRHQYARQWKERTGGKVLGTFCTYIPEELVYAADILPVRILGSHEPEDVTDEHILSMYCFFCRDCLAQGLKGKYDYLDGIVISQCCMHMRQAYQSWRLHLPVDYAYYINMPHHIQSLRAKPYLSGELKEFKTSLEKWIGKSITDVDLDRGIDICNTQRQLMRHVYDLRRNENPAISGLEAMQMVVSGQLTDKREHSRVIGDVLKRLPQREANNEPKVRLMIVGSENDDLEFVGMVESMGASIVVDDHCTGTRYFWNDVAHGNDRLQSIADRYVNRVPCPSKDWPKWRRFDHILSLVEDYHVDGVLLVQQKFCDPHEADMPPLTQFLKENDIPSLFLELAGTMPTGQFNVRLEAFLEMLREDDLF